MSQAWHLVFDHADDPPRITIYAPGDRGGVTITSRNPQCQHYNTREVLERPRYSLFHLLAIDHFVVARTRRTSQGLQLVRKYGTVDDIAEYCFRNKNFISSRNPWVAKRPLISIRGLPCARVCVLSEGQTLSGIQ